MIISGFVLPECSEISVSDRTWTVSMVIVSCARSGISSKIPVPIAVCEGSSGMSCKASVSVEVCGSSGSGIAEVLRVVREGPESAEGSGATVSTGSVSPIALGRSASVNAGCRGSCEGSTWVSVSSDELNSLDSNDSAESSPSIRNTCFYNKGCEKSSYMALQ